MARLIVNPHVLRCFLRPSLTEVPSLRRNYPASLVLRTSPSPHPARPISHELPVDPDRDHRWGFLCKSQVGSCNRFFGACSAFTHVTACTLAESPSDPFHRKLRPLRCLCRRFDCYRVERTSSRAGVAPAEVQRLSRRTFSPIEKLAYRVANGGSGEKEERLSRSGKLRLPKRNCRGQVKPCRRAAKSHSPADWQPARGLGEVIPFRFRIVVHFET